MYEIACEQLRADRPTAINITDDQIRDLAQESAEAGDLAQVAICRRALGESSPTALSVANARAECARVIADAQAQAEFMPCVYSGDSGIERRV